MLILPAVRDHGDRVEHGYDTVAVPVREEARLPITDSVATGLPECEDGIVDSVRHRR